MKRIVEVVTLSALGIAVGACGGGASAKSAPPAAAPGSYAQESQSSQAAPAPPASPQATMPRADPKADSSPNAGAAAPSTAARDRDGVRDPSLRRAVEAAQRELELAGSDCAAACRALGSMERATARLCTLEEASCEDVRVRLLRSRERVRASCGGCPGGPSVNSDAPIPSR